ncbi:MAG: thiolase family protein [Parasporobacterium sp.]|nr:thiolase family protein [Parasporobacterium sp.]
MRKNLGSGGLFGAGDGPAKLIDRAYGRFMGMDTMQITLDLVADKYCRTYGISFDEMDNVLNAFSYNARKNAVRTERALLRKDFDDEAKEHGFDNAMDYLKSDYNPRIARYLRVSGFEATCDAAGAVIVCPTEMAKEFKQKPVEVMGIGMSTVNACQIDNEEKATREAIRQVYEKTGVRPEEIDLLIANDFVITSQLLAAEASGYIPEGEGWKYALEGRTTYYGDKPINTNGGRTNGHAWAASGLEDTYEAVMQLRGLCGERQVKDVNTLMMRGFGGTQNATATILRRVD